MLVSISFGLITYEGSENIANLCVSNEYMGGSEKNIQYLYLKIGDFILIKNVLWDQLRCE